MALLNEQQGLLGRRGNKGGLLWGCPLGRRECKPEPQAFPWLDLPQKTKTVFSLLARLFSAMSSSANPVIYFLVGRRKSRGLREPLGAVLRRALREEPELEGRETPTSTTATDPGF